MTRNHRQLAQDAVDLVRPAIEKLFNQTNRKELHIVVMDPRLKPWEATFEEAILYQESIKNMPWKVPFDELARDKAAQAWRHQQANIERQIRHPSSLRDGDALFYGSFVYGDIVVASSGVEQWFDMLISGWIALAFEQLAMHDHQEDKIVNPSNMYKKSQ